MKNFSLLATFILLSCSPQRVKMGSSSNASVATTLPKNEEFEIQFIPNYLNFGPQWVEGKGYLALGAIKTLGGTLSQETILTLFEQKCGSKCEILSLSPVPGNPYQWSYEIAFSVQENVKIIFPKGISSQEESKTKNDVEANYVYQALTPQEELVQYYSFIPGTAVFSDQQGTGMMILPIGTSPGQLSVDLVALNNLTKPAGCEGLIFNQDTTPNGPLIVAQLPMISEAQICSFTIPQKSIVGTLNGNNSWKNHTTSFVLSLNGILVQENPPQILPQTFQIQFVPITTVEGTTYVNVLSPYALNPQELLSSLVSSCPVNLVNTSSTPSTQIPLALDHTSSCLLTLPGSVFNISNPLVTNNASSLTLLPLTQGQVTTNPPLSVINNYITNNSFNNNNVINLNNYFTLNTQMIQTGSNQYQFHIVLPGELTLEQVLPLLNITSGCANIQGQIQNYTGSTLVNTISVNNIAYNGPAQSVTLNLDLTVTALQALNNIIINESGVTIPSTVNFNWTLVTLNLQTQNFCQVTIPQNGVSVNNNTTIINNSGEIIGPCSVPNATSINIVTEEQNSCALKGKIVKINTEKVGLGMRTAVAFYLWNFDQEDEIILELEKLPNGNTGEFTGNTNFSTQTVLSSVNQSLLFNEGLEENSLQGIPTDQKVYEVSYKYFTGDNFKLKARKKNCSEVLVLSNNENTYGYRYGNLMDIDKMSIEKVQASSITSNAVNQVKICVSGSCPISQMKAFLNDNEILPTVNSNFCPSNYPGSYYQFNSSGTPNEKFEIYCESNNLKEQKTFWIF